MQNSITSRENERVKYACHLAASASFRAGEGLFFAEGVRLCRDLASTLPCRAVFYTQQVLQAFPEAAALSKDSFLISEGVAQKMGETKTPQGLFALFETPAHKLEDLCFSQGILLCEALGDPANVGAVLRSAAGLGFGGVLLAGGCADAYSPKALRAAMGATGRLPVVAGCETAKAVQALKSENVTLYAAALEDALPLSQAMIRPPFALMIGNEGAGLSAAALQAADARVCISMQNGVESLNAAAAAAVLMYHFKNVTA